MKAKPFNFIPIKIEEEVQFVCVDLVPSYLY